MVRLITDMRIAFRLLAVALVAGFVGGCSAMTQNHNPLPPALSIGDTAPNLASAGAPDMSSAGNLIVLVTVPRPHLRPDYVSPSTASLSIKITGPTKFKKSAPLKLGASGCKSKLMSLQCTLVVPSLKACPTKKRCYTATVTTYDAAHHVLSADQQFTFKIGSKPTIVPLVLYGVPASVAFMPPADSNSGYWTGSQFSGFVLYKCMLTPQTVTLSATDKDGNYIVGAGAPKVSLASGDTSQLTVSKGSGPGTFVLSPPASPGYPHGNHTIALTATAKPAKHSGGSAVNTTVNVTYSGDICGPGNGGAFTEFSVPSGAASAPYGIVSGPDGALWFTEVIGNKIGRITTNGSVTEFSGLTPSAFATGIAVGPDSNLWFAECNVSKIGKITTAGAISEYATITTSSAPLSVAAGPDGNLWFTEANANKIGLVTTSGTMLPEVSLTASSKPYVITNGPSSTMYFTLYHANEIGYITPPSTTVSYITIPTASAGPFGLATGPGSDGVSHLWFGEATGNNIGVVTQGRPSVSVEFPLAHPTRSPQLMTPGPDGNIWFTEYGTSAIASITPDGVVIESSIPTAASGPVGIATGPDGAIWFTEESTGKIGRLW